MNNIKEKVILNVPGEKKQVAANLEFNDKEGFKIESFTSLEELDKKKSKVDKRYDLINGLTSNGKLFILLKNLVIRQNPRPGFETSKIRSGILIYGKNYESVDKVKFSRFQVEFRLLKDWIIKGAFSFKEKNNKQYILDAKYKLPISILLFEDDSMQIKLDFKGKVESGIHSVYIGHDVIFDFLMKKPSGIDEILLIINKVRDFLSFAISEKISYKSIKVEIDKEFRVICLKQKIETKKNEKLQTSMLFSFNDFHVQKIKSLFSKWFNKYEEIAPIFDLYFENMYYQRKFSVNYFLNVVFALETYHRRQIGGKKMAEKKFSKYEESILKKLSNEEQEIVKGVFLFGNELNLRMRLNSLLDKSDYSFNKFIIGKKKSFVNKVLQTRNYYVHYDSRFEKKSKNQIIPKENLFDYSLTLLVLLQCCMLDEIGMKKEDIYQAIRRPTINKFILGKNNENRS